MIDSEWRQCSGQREPEGRADTDTTLGLNPAPVAQHDPAHGGQTDAGGLEFPLDMQALKGPEETVGVGRALLLQVCYSFGRCVCGAIWSRSQLRHPRAVRPAVEASSVASTAAPGRLWVARPMPVPSNFRSICRR
jgi:hypothetical protein